MPKPDAIDVVEAVYDLDDRNDDRRWLAGVLERFRPMFDRGLGVCAYLSEPGRPFAAVGALGVPEGWDVAMGALMTSPAGSALLHPSRPAQTASDAVGKAALRRNDAMVRQWHPRGIFDGAGVTANDGTGRLVTLVAPWPEMGSLSARDTARYERIAGHVAAGWRLRRKLERRPTAVLDPGGALLHAEGRARARAARAALRDAARAMDRARGKLRRDDAEALELWRVLVAGEWSLVDLFESDGRRYLVAHENAPHLRDPRGLTLRERQVLGLTALGHSLKLIAYELGVSMTVVSLVRRQAMRKLGLNSVAEAARMMSPGR